MLQVAKSADTRVSGSTFRADIEGLRALAVAGVVAFHFGFPFIQGGFAGVDVFFVISGFLITSHLYRELDETGTIDLWRFYGKRARRLMPMAATVLIATLIAFYWIYSPLEQQEYLPQAAYTAIYGLNIHLLDQALDYFGADASASPFLHYWSLAVEEQFYLLWPAVLIFCFRLFRERYAKALLIGITVLSFLGCLLATFADQAVAFYLLPFRIWQFSAGGLLGIMQIRLPRYPGVVRLIGMVAIVASYLMLTDGMPFPGWLALVPTVGAVLVISAGTAGNDPLLAVLKSRPVVAIGRGSYSIYLWHWPVVVFARAYDPALTWPTAILCLVATAALSVASYYLVEQPIRQSTTVLATRRRMVGLMAGMIALSLSATFVASAFARAGMDERFTDIADIVTNRAADYWQNGKPCITRVSSPEFVTCEFGNRSSDYVVVLAGDSHAGMWSKTLIDMAEKNNWRVITALKSSCSFADVEIWNDRLKRKYHECDVWRRQAWSQIEKIDPDLIIAAQFSSSYVENARDNPHRVSMASWSQGLLSSVQRLAGIADRLVLLRDMPTMGKDVPNCVARAIWRGSPVEACDRAREKAVDDRIAGIERAAVTTVPNARYVDMTDLICDEAICKATNEGQLLYRDAHHISAPFALSAAEPLRQRVKESFGD